MQLSWERTEGAQGYVVDYKLATAANWQSLLVSGTSQVIGSLNPTADYLFRMRTDCGGSAPSAASEIQSWNIRDEAPAVAPELPLALTNPVAVRVQTGVDGQLQVPTSLSALYSNYPRPVGTGSDSTGVGGSGVDSTLTRLKLPYCAAIASSFAGCELPHPSVGLPTGDRELSSLSVGDVLGIYDYAVFVTKVGGVSPLSGEGLARLPFLNGTMVLVEFSGVSAKAGEPGTNGGCVYAVPDGGYFRIKRATQAEVLAQQRSLIASLVSQQASSTTTPGSSTGVVPFVGTLGEALTKYDSVVVGLGTPQPQTLSVATRQALVQYTAAIAQGSESIKNSFDAVYGGNRDPLVVGIRDSLAVLMSQVNQALTSLQSGSAVPGLSVLTARYEALFSQLHQLTNPTIQPPTNLTATYTIHNVTLANVSTTSAGISWQGDPAFTKYVVTYQIQNGSPMTQTVSDPKLALKDLKPGTNYTFAIQAYTGSNLVSSYGKAIFSTLSKVVPPVNNLAYTAKASTATITWDKSKEQLSYKLVYKGEDGIERFVYPTTNQAILTGLDPSQHYTYDIVAYGNDNSQSEARVGAIDLTPCAILLSTPKKIIIEGESTSLLASGCQGGTITWSTGEKSVNQLSVSPFITTTYIANCQLQSGVANSACTDFIEIIVEPATCTGFGISTTKTTVDQGDPITLTANGCQGELKWYNGLGSAKAITVFPTNTTVFKAACLLDDGTTCIASTQVNVTCNLLISVTPYYYNPGLFSRTHRGVVANAICNGSVDSFTYFPTDKATEDIYQYPGGWLGGTTLVFEKKPGQISVTSVKSDITFSASCNTGSETCAKQITVRKPSCDDFTINASHTNNQLVLTGSGCDEGNLIDWENWPRGQSLTVPIPTKSTQFKATCGHNGCEAYYTFTVSNQNVLTVAIASNDKTLISASGCKNGIVTWSSEPTSTFTVSPYLSSNGSPMISLPTSPQQTTTYIATCKTADNRISQGSYTYPVESKCLYFNDSPLKIDKGNPINLDVIGCLGTVSWKANEVSLSMGTSITHVPLVRTTYTAYCDNPVCSVSRTIDIGDCALRTMATKTTAIKPGETVIIGATGCAGGIINWQDQSGNFIGSGSSLTIRPVQSGQWKATCSTTDCSHLLFLAVPPVFPAKITCEDFSVNGPGQVNKGEPNKVTLTATGCTGGVVTWNGPGLATNTQTEGETHQVIIADLRDKATYTAQCKKPGFDAVQKTLTIEATLRLDVIANPNPVESGKTTTLTASGCAGGTITWKSPNKTGPSPCVVQSGVLTQATTFEATCLSNGESVTKQLTVGIRNANGASVYQAQGCSSFGAFYSYSDYSHSPPPKGTDVRLTASGCTTGRVDWEADGNLIAQNKTDLTHKPLKTTTYTASCYTPDGLLCARQFITAKIHESACNTFSVQATPSTIGGPAKVGGGQSTPTNSDGSLSSSVTVNNVPYRIDITGCLSKDNPLFAGQITINYQDQNGNEIPNGSSTPVYKLKVSCQADKQSYPEELCQRTVTFSNGNPIVMSTSDPNAPGASGRLGANMTTASDGLTGAARQAADADCKGSLSASALMAGYMQTMLCANLELFYDDQRGFSEDRVMAFLQSAVTTLAQQPEFKGVTFALPTDLTALLAGLKAANHQCTTLPAVAEVATSNFRGELPVVDYNKVATSTFRTVENAARAVLMTDLQCGCQGLADYSSTDGDCKSIIAELGKLKAAYTNQQNLTLTKPAKNPLIGQVSLGGVCYSDVQLAYVPDRTSLLIEPSYSQGSSSFGLGNGGNTYLTISLTNPQPGQVERLKAYLFSGTTSGKATFPVTGAQLKQIFPGTSQSRCDEVAALLNKYSDQFGLTNAVRMSHFIGQIGAETNLSNLIEGTYSASRIKAVWANATRSYNGKTVLKYCDLFEGYDAVQTNDCPFPYCDPPLYVGTTGLEVKQKYVKSTALFDYVYACRLGNGSIDSKDGSRFRGRGFLQLTGYENYQNELQDNWDLAYGKGNKDFLCRSVECDANLELVGTNLEIALQTALAFWKAHDINASAIDVTDGTIKSVSKIVNGGTNGLDARLKYTQVAYKIFNK